MQEDKEKDWSGRTGGTHWMQESLIGIFRWINPAWVYPIVWIWISFYILFGRTARHGIWHYWRRAQQKGRLSACVNLYLNYLEFGKAILDRFAAYSGRQVEVTTEGEEILEQLCSQETGIVVLSSHIGNQELAGYSFKAPKPMKVLTYLGDTETVQENRRRQFERQGLYLIAMQQDGSHIWEMHETLQRGEILSIHADRLFADSRTLEGLLLGQKARYPQGPFRMATREQVPVVCLFMMRERIGHYRLYVRQLTAHTEKELLEQYIAANEEMLKRYPRQWFHFYDFFK